MTIATQDARQGTGFAARFRTLREAWIAGRTARRAYNQVMEELTALSPRELADLGINRSMIRELARDEAQRRAYPIA